MNTSRFDAWIHGSIRVSSGGLACYRIVFAAFTLLVIAPGHDLYTDLRVFASLPSSMFVPPPGPMMLFGGFPSVLTAELLLAALNVSLVAVLFGYRTRLFSIATGLLLLTIFGFSYSLGKINHNLLFTLVPLVMAFSNWGGAISYDARYRPAASPAAASWPVMMLLLLLGFAMFTAGFAKILGGWLDPETQAAYGHVVKHYVVRGRTDLLASLAFSMDNDSFWEVQDYVTVLFETGFLAAVAYPRLARTFAGLAVFFHFGVMLTLNISFAFNLVVYAAFVDWEGNSSIHAPEMAADSFAFRKPGAPHLRPIRGGSNLSSDRFAAHVARGNRLVQLRPIGAGGARGVDCCRPGRRNGHSIVRSEHDDR